MHFHALGQTNRTGPSEKSNDAIEGGISTSRPKFVVNAETEAGSTDRADAFAASTCDDELAARTTADGGDDGSGGQGLLSQTDNSSWRDEVSARLHRYRARRKPRAPRYPSLRLKFEMPENSWPTSVRNADAVAGLPTSQLSSGMASRQSVAMDCAEIEVAPEVEAAPRPPAETVASALPEQHRAETTAKIIEFPRPAYAPPSRLHELADPVIDRPRILEAPEVVPPPPALGGITIEEAVKAEPERRPGIDMPLRPAALGERTLAVAIDGLIVLLSGAVFAAIFFQLSHQRPTPVQVIAPGSVLLVVCWAVYQYLLLVYSGTTLGLRALKLQLYRFDGMLPNRRLRRWRVLGSLLSGISLGMGYAWQFLDEDQLCWHERVTKTYLAPRAHDESA